MVRIVRLAVVEMEQWPEVRVVPEGEVPDARLDSRVRIRRFFLYQSSASTEYRHMKGTYHHVAVDYMEVDDRERC